MSYIFSAITTVTTIAFTQSPEVTLCGWRGYNPSINKQHSTNRGSTCSLVLNPSDCFVIWTRQKQCGNCRQIVYHLWINVLLISPSAVYSVGIQILTGEGAFRTIVSGSTSIVYGSTSIVSVSTSTVCGSTSIVSLGQHRQSLWVNLDSPWVNLDSLWVNSDSLWVNLDSLGQFS